MVFNGYSMVWICLLCLHSTAPVLSVFEALAGTQSALQWPGFPPNLPASQPTEPKLLLLLDRVGQPVSAGNEEEICKPSGSANVNKILIRFNQIQTHSSWGRLESFILIHIFVWLCLKIGYPIPSTGSSISRFQMVNPLVMVNRWIHWSPFTGIHWPSSISLWQMTWTGYVIPRSWYPQFIHLSSCYRIHWFIHVCSMAQKLEALRGTGRASILGSAVQGSGQRRLGGVYNFGFGVPMGNPHLGNIQYGKIWETVGKIWKNGGYIYIYINIYIYVYIFI